MAGAIKYVTANTHWGRLGSQLMEEFSAQLVAEAFGYTYLYQDYKIFDSPFLVPAASLWPRFGLGRGELDYREFQHLPRYEKPGEWANHHNLEDWAAEMSQFTTDTVLCLPRGTLPYALRWNVPECKPRDSIERAFPIVRQRLREKAGLLPPPPKPGPIRSVCFYVRGWAPDSPDFDINYARQSLRPDLYVKALQWIDSYRGTAPDFSITIYSQGPEEVARDIPHDRLIIIPEHDSEMLWAATFDMVMCDACVLGHGQFGNLISLYRNGLMFSINPRESGISAILL